MQDLRELILDFAVGPREYWANIFDRVLIQIEIGENYMDEHIGSVIREHGFDPSPAFRIEVYEEAFLDALAHVQVPL